MFFITYGLKKCQGRGKRQEALILVLTVEPSPHLDPWFSRLWNVVEGIEKMTKESSRSDIS